MFIKRFVFTILVAALAFAGAAPAAAAPAKPGGGPPPPPAAVAPDAVTQQTLAINGKTYPYTARAGTIALEDQHGQATCRMFFTAFTLDGVNPSTRPVTFFYNGGPGSSTIWLRMGSFGPMRVAIGDASSAVNAPFQLVQNQYTLLDRSDLVFVDAPGTGFSRIVGDGKPTDFYGVDQDMRAFTQFVSRYVSTYGRWNSPKFLFGESYGTPRSAVLVNNLQRQGIGINGVVLLVVDPRLQLGLGHQFHAGGDRRRRLGVSALPAHRGGVIVVSPRAAGSANGLADARCPKSNSSPWASISTRWRKERSSRRRRTTTSSPSSISTRAFRRSTSATRTCAFPTGATRPNCCETTAKRSAATTLATLRTRSTASTTGPISTPPTRPSMPPSSAPETTYVRQLLHYNTDAGIPAADLRRLTGSGTGSTTATCRPTPRKIWPTAMTFNPGLHVFSANGYYDLATPFYATVYTLNHLNLAPPLQNNITYGFYESGHMVYLHPQRSRSSTTTWNAGTAKY